MLLEFEIENFRSIKHRQTFSMLPKKNVKELPGNVLTLPKFSALTSSVIYGRNGSGKSNLLLAFHALVFLVENSSEFKIDTQIAAYEPNKLDSDFRNAPVRMSITFVAKDSVKYNYSISYNKTEIISETLSYYRSAKPTRLFTREKGNKIVANEKKIGKYKGIEEKLYPNQLFLSKVGKEKFKTLIPAYMFLTRHFSTNIFHDTRFDNMLIRSFTRVMNEKSNSNFPLNINKLLTASDIGIKSISVKELDEDQFQIPSDIGEEIKKKFLEETKYSIRTRHDVFKGGKVVEEVEFSLDEESTGTKKLMATGGIIISALEDGDVLLIDELDKSLHPLLTKALIQVFNNPQTNPNNAQLIFASHDVSLLDTSIFRRDQVWFSEKNEEGASYYYSVSDIPNIRKVGPYEKWYMSGRFRAIPVINECDLHFKFN